MSELTQQQRDVLTTLATRLVDQERARIIVRPVKPESGYWFGGGNVVKDDEGRLLITGRYRNYGDSRTGVEAGARGFECAIFCSDDGGESFHKVKSWNKADLSRIEPVVSIEGTALLPAANGKWELFISVEKDIPYPEPYAHYQKPGTGVWQIDKISGSSLESLDIETLSPVLVNRTRPEYLHIKDPFIISAADGQTKLGFCSHPISWASSNSGVAVRAADSDEFEVSHWEMVSRGPIWDVAATRVTAHLPVPARGVFASRAPVSIYFYDGAECIRQHDENRNAFTRPRGYSCEELGGALWGWDDDFPKVDRLSVAAPLFISPWGSGSSRYVDVLVSDEGIRAIWQQSQPDGSQPLVTHFLPMDEVEQVLAG